MLLFIKRTKNIIELETKISNSHFEISIA